MHPIGYAVIGILGIFGFLKVKEKVDSKPRVGDLALVAIGDLQISGTGQTVSAAIRGSVSSVTPASVRITNVTSGDSLSGTVTPPGIPAEIQVLFSRAKIITLSRNGKNV